MTGLRLEQFLPYRLNRIASAVSQDFRSIYGPRHDLTIPEWRLLATLGQFEAMSARDIGRHSSMHKTKVSRAVRALEERRWLRRQESEEDRREEILTLTALGRKSYREIVPKALAFEHRILADLGPEAGTLLAALDRLEEIFKRT
jgi:DNA-binding MarR family transcriptional regulator